MEGCSIENMKDFLDNVDKTSQLMRTNGEITRCKIYIISKLIKNQNFPEWNNLREKSIEELVDLLIESKEEKENHKRYKETKNLIKEKN